MHMSVLVWRLSLPFRFSLPSAFPFGPQLQQLAPYEQGSGCYNCFCWHGAQVNRVRNKWKITLKQGIVHIDGHEYVFNKANGEFIF
jgi:Transcription factor IIA, alpha/beta subunit